MDTQLEVGDGVISKQSNTEELKGVPRHAPVYVGSFSTPDAGVLRCVLPAGLDLTSLCETTAEGARWPTKHQYKLAFIVHSIMRGYQQRHATGEDDTARGVPLNVELLRFLLVKNGSRDFAKEAIDALEGWKVIECVGDYYANKRSRRYCLAAPFDTAPAIRHSFIAPKLVTKLRDAHRREAARCGTIDPVFAFVRENLATVSLTDAGRAEAAMQVPTFPNPRTQSAWLLSVDDLEEPALHFSHSQKTGRIYHTVANCPVDLRRHLLIDGESTAEVDMSAAQFFLLLDLYPAPSAERDRYAAKVASGLFYEHLFKSLWARGEASEWGDGSVPLADVWRWTGGAGLRGAFKKHALRKLLYERLYSSTREAGIWPAFAEEFPILSGAITARRYSKPATSAFCCEMQRREASLVLGRVVPRIRKELIGCKPVTIHDGIMCQAQFARAVQSIVIEEARTVYCAEPAVKVKAGVFPVTTCEKVS